MFPPARLRSSPHAWRGVSWTCHLQLGARLPITHCHRAACRLPGSSHSALKCHIVLTECWQPEMPRGGGGKGKNGAMRDQDNDLQHPCMMPSLRWGECCPTSITTPQSISYTLVGGSSDIHLPSTKTPFHKGFSCDSSYSSGRALWLYIPTNTALTPHLKYDDQGKRLPIP